MSTKARREYIIELIKSQEISKQDELVKILCESGYTSTQATISRDIKELGLIKIKGESVKSKYALPTKKEESAVTDEQAITLLRTFIVSIENAQNLVVIKTLTGNGSACGMVIDKIKPEGVVGSIAGDDTLLIVTHNQVDAIKVVNQIKGLINL